MTALEKQQLISAVTTAIETVFDGEENSKVKQDKPTEMLTIKECTVAVKGLNEFTVRQLVARNEIPYVRCGIGKRGKILIPKAALIEYLNGRKE